MGCLMNTAWVFSPKGGTDSEFSRALRASTSPRWAGVICSQSRSIPYLFFIPVTVDTIFEAAIFMRLPMASMALEKTEVVIAPTVMFPLWFLPRSRKPRSSMDCDMR